MALKYVVVTRAGSLLRRARKKLMHMITDSGTIMRAVKPTLTPLETLESMYLGIILIN